MYWIYITNQLKNFNSTHMESKYNMNYTSGVRYKWVNSRWISNYNMLLIDSLVVSSGFSLVPQLPIRSTASHMEIPSSRFLVCLASIQTPSQVTFFFTLCTVEEHKGIVYERIFVSYKFLSSHSPSPSKYHRRMGQEMLEFCFPYNGLEVALGWMP